MIITYMHGLAVYVKEGIPFAESLENSVDYYLWFRLALLNSLSYFFLLYWSPSSSLPSVFEAISPDEVLSIKPSSNLFNFGDFNAYYKDWLTYPGGTNRLGELCYNLKWPYSDGYPSY